MISNIFKHTAKILKHKTWVAYYMFRCGYIWRGLMHDMSKFSPVEFLESAKYYQGDSSPIVACKKDNGYSLAWQHHKGHNPHHYEYWIDQLDKGGVPIKMPYDYVVELICDYLGAARAYLGDNFSYHGEYYWWLEKLEKENPKIHEQTKQLITLSLQWFETVDDFDYYAIRQIAKRINY